ncbi:uncharacterized protein LOC106644368 [Copidosoma floridanum]|uniref:uncharacterized protein LOC106644368 n=1 Tax=Copidosoma floridanum TaxID=29053 RepID=UPI0006C97CAB|nr:uncharacterized protein LOC106644368 [Copidosoma floridanum]
MINAKKTPVSVLNELMVKKSQCPNWELIHDGGGTHQNLFIWRVTCDGHSVEGQGRNKRDAKHEAATKMLELIGQLSKLPQLQATPQQSPVRTPLPVDPPTCPKSPANAPFRNTVGELKDLCGMHRLDQPQYKETGDIGPAHARVFTIECSVLAFTEEGTATTKKQAKHEAARKMIDRITRNLDSVSARTLSPDSADSGSPLLDYETEASIKKAIDKYPELSKLHALEQGKLKVNMGLKICKYFLSFQELVNDFFITEEHVFVEELDNLIVLAKQCQENFDESKMTVLTDKFKNILESIDVKGYEVTLPSRDNDIHIVGVRINTAPDICETGIGKTDQDALLTALLNVFYTMKLFLE